MPLKIRKAKMKDVREIHKLLNHFAEKKELLARSLSELYENLQQFFVAEDTGHVVGCCSLSVTWDNLAEIKALAVAGDYQGRGIGRKLLQACLNDAQGLGVTRIFTLTMKDGFFQKLGFKNIAKHFLPHKIWTECVRCPYFPETCVEIAMTIDLAVSDRRMDSSDSGLPDAVMGPLEMMVPSEPKAGVQPKLSGRRR